MKRQIIVGPFKEASRSAQSFSLGMYYSHCLNETVTELVKLQEEYDQAVASSNEALIAEKEKELSFYENIVLIATDAYTTISAETFDSGSLHD